MPNAAPDPPNHLFAPLLSRAEVNPDQTFCVFVQGARETELSVAQVVASAAAFGRDLLAAGAERGSVVLIVLDHSEHLYSAFIGAVLAGLVPSFMPPLTRKQDPRIHHASMKLLIDRIRPAAIVTSEASTDLPPDANIPRVFVESVERADDATRRAQAERAALLQPIDIAFLQHSSGTTGLKKGVMLSHDAVLTQCRLYGDAINMMPGDTVLSWLPLYHDMGLIACFLLPAVVGVPVVSLDALEWVMRPTTLLQRIEQHQARYVWLPNFAFQHIARLDLGKRPWNLGSLKALVSCSEPCRSATFDAFLERYGPAGLKPEALQVSYALAENVFAATHSPSGRTASSGRSERTRGFVSCGTVLPETRLQIRSSDGSHLLDGEIGEIFLNSSCLFDGYFRQPELTKEKLADGWYRTGDLGTVEDGELFVIGRLDDLLIVNGKNLMAHEIEDELNSLPGLIPGRILAHSRFDDELGTSQLLILAERSEPEAERAEIEARIRSSVYTISGVYPSEVRFVEPGFLVKSSSGKIARVASARKLAETTA